jgi:hypothetical protein
VEYNGCVGVGFKPTLTDANILGTATVKGNSNQKSGIALIAKRLLIEDYAEKLYLLSKKFAKR